MSSTYKLFTVVLLLATLCCGKNLPEDKRENALEIRNSTEARETPVLQHGYNDDGPPRGVVIVSPIVVLLIIGCCVYFCCRCRSQRNQGVVVNLQRPLPPPIPQTIIIQHQQPVQQQPAQPLVQQIPYAKQHAPPPYDTQPYPQQQFHSQGLTSFENPNYAPQPPVNMQYGQEKY